MSQSEMHLNALKNGHWKAFDSRVAIFQPAAYLESLDLGNGIHARFEGIHDPGYGAAVNFHLVGYEVD